MTWDIFPCNSAFMKEELRLLHALEGVSRESEIGSRAGNLLDALSHKDSKGEGFLADKVHQLRHTTRDEM